MTPQLPITLLLFLIASHVTAQENRKFFYATIQDEMGAVANAHVINLTTKQGTFTNDFGKFKVLAKPNDTLQISFVGYETKKIVVAIHHFGIQENTIQLKKVPIELDEVAIKKHHLIGFIAVDTKQTPKDIAADKSKSALDFSMIDFKKSIILPIDEMDRAKAPNMLLEIDPISKFAGVGSGFSTGLDKYSANLKALRKDINYKETFPKMLLSEFGEHFFFKELKIPEEKYLHFLAYCNPLGIEKLYKEGKVLKVIAILKEESKSYLKIKNEER
ncbi:carboxypeptidase-like regulatory domain-containing protein [Tenacibaculum tangerinum]|uniref:Carboxypeptidase-like regulatory domain-containing protein n=1 Tax=Tenacibaculum tangerinum TaxID=3038772 RepID=A0ABY8L5K4_9FLAO|nr:carboxypeptidase-like regulatory domain-containing protein [Tenacibaculum tangerinum]WGH76675.1 carboxypeptidase-like regulatory domain-containing protein [Tenacibaculum tangerinum]